MRRWLAAAALPLVLAGCSVVGVRSGTEEPSYQLVTTIDREVEIRRYGERVAVVTEVEAEDHGARLASAFRRLASYIGGENEGGREIAMTAPVETSREIAMTAPVEVDDEASSLRMRFFLPERYAIDSAPRPTSAEVTLERIAPREEAVLRFSGSRSPSAVSQKSDELLEGLAGSAWSPEGEIRAYFYDPPWTLPFRRRNEVTVAVSRS